MRDKHKKPYNPYNLLQKFVMPKLIIYHIIKCRSYNITKKTMKSHLYKLGSI